MPAPPSSSQSRLDAPRENFWERLWYSPQGQAPWLLRALGQIYGGLMSWRARLYGPLFKIKKAAKPVISIGNLTVGGTGKTPLCLALARRLTDDGLKVAILSRGYGRRGKEPLALYPGGPPFDWRTAGDEPALMAGLCRAVILIDTIRARAAERAVRDFGADVLLMDDGFQHLALKADCRLLLAPARNPFGNGLVLPAGPLREPLGAHRRASILVETGVKEPGSALKKLAGPRPCFAAHYRPLHFHRLSDGKIFDLATLENQKILAFCALGRPASFYRSLEDLGLEILGARTFRDHSPYDEKRLESLAATFEKLKKKAGASFLVTSAKDAVKIDGKASLAESVLVLDIDLEMNDFETFYREVRSHAGL